MLHTLLRPVVVLALAAACGSALAGTVTFSGKLGDPTNPNVVASDLGAAQFSDDQAKANNVALHALHVAIGGSVTFTSTGWASGGVDPYFTLFSGTDWATATFVDSNYLHALAVGGDFTQAITVPAGDYTIALGAYENLSFAENLGSGVLADGFIGLGDSRFLGDGSYSLAVLLPDARSVPEPGGLALTLTASCAALLAARSTGRRRKAQTPNGGER